MVAGLISDLELIQHHCAAIWPRLAGQHLFITGGTGFFGRWLLEGLCFANLNLNLDLHLTVLTRNVDRFREKAPHLFDHSFLHFQVGDVQNFIFPAGPVDYLLHAATEADAKLNAESPLLMVDTVVSGSRRVLEMAREKKVKGVLLTSSGAIYGRQPTDMSLLTENFTGGPNITDPFWAYGESKRMAELLGAIYYKQFGVPVKTARCFAFVGPFLPLDTHFAVGNFIRNALQHETIVIKGDGTPFRSYLYAADLVIWLLHIMVDGQAGNAYNVGSDKEITIGGLAGLVASLLPAAPDPVILTAPVPGQPAERYLPSITKARQELGLEIYTPMEESIRKTMVFYQTTPS